MLLLYLLADYWPLFSDMVACVCVLLHYLCGGLLRGHLLRVLRIHGGEARGEVVFDGARALIDERLEGGDLCVGGRRR
jgi:hypothetical protein